MRLASHLRLPLSELQERMSFEEFMLWCAWFQFEPFGKYAETHQNAVAIATMVNLWSEKKTDASTFLTPPPPDPEIVNSGYDLDLIKDFENFARGG